MPKLPVGVAVLFPAAVCGLGKKVGTGRFIILWSCFSEGLFADGVSARREVVAVLFAEALLNTGGL